MKKLLLLPILLLILSACSFNNDGYTFSEISSFDYLDDTVQEFFMSMESNEEGIYIYKVSNDKFYLYLSPKYITHNGNNFMVDVETEKDLFNVYLTDFSPKEEDIREYRLYEFYVEKEYEYLRTFKNGVETHIQVIGS